MTRRSTRIFSFTAAAAFMLACVTPALFAPTPTPIPTFDTNALNLVIAQTANAAATQTALMMPPTFTPTATPRPTSTITPTPTATFYFVVATITVPPTQIPAGTSGLEYECQILSQTPQNNSVMARSSAFETRWLVANIGKAGWDQNNADYRYTGGNRLHKDSIRDLDASVSPGGTIELIVNMQSPNEPGTYSTSWRITIGKNEFCPMDLTITVN